MTTHDQGGNVWSSFDIDGVLASVDYLCRTSRQPYFIDKEKITLLNKLKDYDVEVVISSSWGYNDDTVIVYFCEDILYAGPLYAYRYFTSVKRRSFCHA